MGLVGPFREISAEMSARFKQLQDMHHLGDRGENREAIVKDFLNDYLPKRFGIGNGEVRDRYGSWSRQQDVVIFDVLNCPVLLTSNHSQIFPIDNVFATIQVKSALNKKELVDCSVNIQSVRRLRKASVKTQLAPGVSAGGPPSPTAGVVFAFDADTSLKTLKANLLNIQENVPLSEKINLICILDKAVFMLLDPAIWSNLPATQEVQVTFAGMDTGKDTLLFFYLQLMQFLKDVASGIPNLASYALEPDAKLFFKSI